MPKCNAFNNNENCLTNYLEFNQNLEKLDLEAFRMNAKSTNDVIEISKKHQKLKEIKFCFANIKNK